MIGKVLSTPSEFSRDAAKCFYTPASYILTTESDTIILYARDLSGVSRFHIVAF